MHGMAAKFIIATDVCVYVCEYCNCVFLFLETLRALYFETLPGEIGKLKNLQIVSVIYRLYLIC